MVLERTSQGERSYDLYSRLLKSFRWDGFVSIKELAEENARLIQRVNAFEAQVEELNVARGQLQWA